VISVIDQLIDLLSVSAAQHPKQVSRADYVGRRKPRMPSTIYFASVIAESSSDKGIVVAICLQAEKIFACHISEFLTGTTSKPRYIINIAGPSVEMGSPTFKQDSL
jgi:hypothetical protein